MKHVAISTIAKEYLLTNFGSFFQHYALRKVLKSLGFHPFRVQSTKERKYKILHIVESLKNFLRPYYWAVKRLPQRRFYVMRIRKNKEQVRLFETDYKSLIGEIEEPMTFDESTVGIMGGDQVLWVDEERVWLHDIKDGNPIISYAASGDWEFISNDLITQQFLKNELVRFSAIGVREQLGVDLISKILSDSKSIKHVIDSVLFLSKEDYFEIQSQKAIFKKPTLFCYLVNIRSMEELQLDKYISLAKNLDCDLKMLGIQGADVYIPNEFSVSLSPREFLRAIYDSQYYITNSFHGSVFALIYEKNFLSVSQNNRPGRDQNQRQKELMQKYDVANRWVGNESLEAEMKLQLEKKQDWASIRQKIIEDRENSLSWLKQAVGD